MKRLTVLALPLLIAACGVENDPANDQVTLTYNEEEIEDTAADVGNTAETVAEDVGNAAESAADEVGNRVDVDVDVNSGDEAAETTNAN